MGEGKKSEESSEDETSTETTKQSNRKPKEEGSLKRKRKPSGSSHPSTLEMVLEAMETLKDPKGMSVQSIKNYILDEYKMVRPEMLKHMLRSAFNKGLKENKLERPKPRDKPLNVMSGSYRLVAAPQWKQTKRQTDIAALARGKKGKKKSKKQRTNFY